MKKHEIKISIITINLNNNVGLINTINSVISQKMLNHIEWILIDGQSSDSSLDSIKNIQTSLNHKIISEKDNGIYFAMNKGIELSSGELLIFLNSGDIFENKDCIELILNAYEKFNADLMLFGFKYFNKHKFSKPLFWRFWGMPTSHQAMVYSRKLIKENIYDTSYKLAGDYDNFMKICKKTNKIKIINNILVVNENYGSDKKLDLLKQEYKHILIKYSNKLFGTIINTIKFFYLKNILKFRY